MGQLWTSAERVSGSNMPMQLSGGIDVGLQMGGKHPRKAGVRAWGQQSWPGTFCGAVRVCGATFTSATKRWDPLTLVPSPDTIVPLLFPDITVTKV